ncbi:UDP-2,3-diacylglucosamine hydrolase [Planctomycetes bacterium Pan216]|uniref:UDP-2,3-diacylglucosamine hydrolase n=1 Tax=Kolteria novifilia TaxID=2527975 RepID=A0A518B8K2_9BACT|nr:UDP-2,3-diacylglucosamine hydrolase [Planctomycetes bacterium Pan216]
MIQQDVPVTPKDSRSLETPIVVLSDLHLAHPATYLKNPEFLRPLLDGARTLILNGDTFEQLNLARRSEALDKGKQLLEQCAEQGISTVLITGNHDPQASSLHHLDLFGGRVFLTHGDMLHPAIAPWSSDARVLLAEHHRLLGGGPEPDDLDEALRLTKRSALVGSIYDDEVRAKAGWWARFMFVGRFALQPWRVPMALIYWANVSHYATVTQRRFRPDSKLMLIGHTHRPGVWQHHDFTLVNTGSFHPMSKPLLVRMNENEAVVLSTRRRGDHFEPGSVLHHVPIAR